MDKESYQPMTIGQVASEGQKGNKKKREKNISLDFERESGNGGKKNQF